MQNSAEPAFEVKSIPGKGRGLIATRKIALGELLIDEAPLVVGPEGGGLWLLSFCLLASLGLLVLSFDLDLASFQGWLCLGLLAYVTKSAAGFGCKALVIFGRVRGLSAVRREQYYELQGDTWLYVPALSEVRIFHLNAVSDDGAGGCVCAIASLVNHSCVPNAVFSWEVERDRHQVQALRDIAPGEEIATSYIGLWLPGKARRKALQRGMGFSCACLACTRRKEEETLSDSRRQMCKKLEQGLPAKISGGQVKEAVWDMQRLQSMAEQELGIADSLITRDMQDCIRQLQGKGRKAHDGNL